MKNKNMKMFKIIKLILFILTIVLLVTLSIKLFPLFINLGTSEGQLKFKSEMDNSGIQGMFMLLGLQLLQILVPVLPGEPIEFLSGMCYGAFGGMLLIFVGAFMSSFIIFFCVRKFGKDFINTFFGENNIQKIENSKWFSDTKKIELFMFIAFLIPGTPKDLLVYIAGLLPIRPFKFFMISTFCRFPSVISSTLAGSTLVDGNWKMTLFIYIITFIVSALGLYIYNSVKNRKYVKEAEK